MPVRRIHRSPNVVTLDEVIQDQIKRLRFLEENKARKVATGEMSEWTANHKIAMQKEAIRILRAQLKKTKLF